MKSSYRGVLTLIRSAITGEKAVLPEDFDPEEAFALMAEHQLLSIGYAGALGCGLPKDSETVKKFFAGYCRSTMHSQAQLGAVRKLFEAFDRAEIAYLPVKGVNLKALYPVPEYRVMGDADILIRTEQYDRIRSIMEALGYGGEREAGNVMVWTSRDLHVELHKSLMPPEFKAFARRYGTGWPLATQCRGTHYSMTPEDEFIFVFIHFAKHYQQGGIGLRQILDLWICRRAHPDLDQIHICQALEGLGLLEFYRNVLDVLEVWFGDGEENEKTELITDYIMTSGSWGSEKAGCLSVAAGESQRTRSDGKGRRRWIVRIFFPEPEAMKNRYPRLARHPVLLPAFWVWRWVEVLRDHPGNIRSKLTLAGTVSDEEVSAFRRAMNAVGLSLLEEE